MRARKWSQADLARRVGISRQAISLWFKSDEVSIRSRHLFALANVLGVSVDTLAAPLPAFGSDHRALRTTYLWDRLYPDLDNFAIAVGRRELPAIARLVQVSGLYVAERVVGRSVWKVFSSYKRFIHPARRRQLEGLVQWRLNRQAS